MWNPSSSSSQASCACDALSSEHLREILELGGYSLPWTRGDMAQFDDLLRKYRALSRPDQMVVRRWLLWHLLGLQPISAQRVAV